MATSLKEVNKSREKFIEAYDAMVKRLGFASGLKELVKLATSDLKKLEAAGSDLQGDLESYYDALPDKPGNELGKASVTDMDEVLGALDNVTYATWGDKLTDIKGIIKELSEAMSENSDQVDVLREVIK